VNKYINSPEVHLLASYLSFIMQLEIMPISALIWKIFLENIHACSHKSFSWHYLPIVDIKPEIVFYVTDEVCMATFSLFSFLLWDWNNMWSKWAFTSIHTGKGWECLPILTIYPWPPYKGQDLTGGRICKDVDPHLRALLRYTFSFLKKESRKQTWCFLFFHFALKGSHNLKGQVDFTYSFIYN
jgi:hypothetical protein